MSDPKDVVLTDAEGGFDSEGSKRTYMPYILEWTCPDCGYKNVWDLRSDYLSYPVFGKVEDLTLYCNGGEDTADGWEECGYEGKVKAIARLTLELVP